MSDAALSGEDRLEGIMKERDAVYGDASRILSNTGLAVTALIQQHYGIVLDHPLPVHIMCEINILIKVMRVANPGFHRDSLDDQIGYAKLALQVSEEESK